MTKKKKKNLQFNIITIFPEIFENYFDTSIIKRAQQKKLIKIKIHNLRDWAEDKSRPKSGSPTIESESDFGRTRQWSGHKTVDDKPYGGGPGMIVKADVIYRALSKIKNQPRTTSGSGLPCTLRGAGQKSKIILLSPAGKQFNQKIAYRYSKLDRIILICGHYEGVDARVEKFVDEKISVGPYVLTGGELPAMVIVDAVTRLISGVIRAESLKEESFSQLTTYNLQLTTEYPQYTRPEVLTIKDKYGRIKVLKVPKVLLSGNHQKIKEWRMRKMRK